MHYFELLLGKKKGPNVVDENNIDEVIAQLAREQDKPSSDNYKAPKLKVEPTAVTIFF